MPPRLRRLGGALTKARRRTRSDRGGAQGTGRCHWARARCPRGRRPPGKTGGLACFPDVPRIPSRRPTASMGLPGIPPWRGIGTRRPSSGILHDAPPHPWGSLEWVPGKGIGTRRPFSGILHDAPQNPLGTLHGCPGEEPHFRKNTHTKIVSGSARDQNVRICIPLKVRLEDDLRTTLDDC